MSTSKKSVFISCAPQDHKLAKSLVKELRAHKIAVYPVVEPTTQGAEWQQKVEKTIKGADTIVIIVDPEHTPCQYQQFEWSTALEASWEDSRKRLIPVLLKNAELPGFLSSDQKGLRVPEPEEEWGQAVKELIHIILDETMTTGETLITKEEVRRQQRARLQYIEKAVQAMRQCKL